MKAITRTTGARVVATLSLALLFAAREARAAKVDFLWVIDNSPSMSDKQAVLSAAADNIANQFANAKCSVDWRMAVTYTDLHIPPSSNDVCSGSPGPGRRRLCPFTTDINVFKNGTPQCAYVKAGSCGDSSERGFSSAGIAINDLLAGSGCEPVPGAECALRPDARLAVIFFTDTGEQTPASSPAPGEPDDSVASWVRYFGDYDLLTLGMQRAQVHGILCPLRPTPQQPAPCGDTLADPALFDRYSEVISQLGGTEGSINDQARLSDSIMKIVDATIAGACCGNGHLDPGEECDDGNLDDGDCCSSSCRLEPSTTMCRSATGPCDVAEFCTGTSPTCPADAFKPTTFECRGATGSCDVAEFCTGTSATCPADGFQPATLECRPAAGACDVAEFCTGTSGLCPADAKSTGVCRAAAGTCDVAESCDGVSNDCPADAFSASTIKCRPSAGPCDQAEFCTGTSAACPADTFKPTTFECRGATGSCDVAEFCTGTSATCPADGFQPATLECRPAAGACDVAEFCTGTSGLCPTDAKSTGVCRAAAGTCDVAESCNGVSNDCPADAFSASTVKCRPSAGPCDQTEFCTGTSAACPTDGFKPATTKCRATAGVCDVAEFCTGTGAACPADAKSMAVCRPAAGPCDAAESCDGLSNDCPADVLKPANTECRPAAGDCDLPELCTGTSSACPSDTIKPAGTECRAAAGECDVAETCSGTSATCPTDRKRTDVCRPSTGPCDPAERCDGSSDSCPADVLTADGTACSDGNACTQGDVCQAGECQGGTPVTCSAPDQCHEAGVCDPGTGLCSNPVKHDGTSCDDGNACTEHESCRQGRCIGGTAVSCADADACTVDTCNPTTGCVHRHFEGMAALDCFCSSGMSQTSCTNERVPACVPKHLMRACRLIARAHEAKPKKAQRFLVRAKDLLSKGSRLAQRANRRARISTTCATSLSAPLDDAAGRLQALLTTP